MPYEMFLTIQLMHLTCRKDCVHNHLQEKKDETCSEEQVMTDKEEYDDTFKEEISDTVQLCNTVERHH